MPKKGSKRLGKKAGKLLKQAEEQVQPSERLQQYIRGMRTEFDPNPPDYDHVMTPLHKKTNCLLYEKYIPRWEKVADELDVINKQKKWHDLETRATRLIVDMQRVDALFRKQENKVTSDFLGEEVHNPGRSFITSIEPKAFFYRGQAKRIGDGNHLGAVEDYTEALLTSGALISAGMNDDIVVQCLDCRSMAFLALYEQTEDVQYLEKAIQDLRAACAQMRASGCDNTLNNCLGRLLMAMTRKKLASGVKRPHYTHQERSDIEKELGINNYAKEKHLCGHCGTKHKLRLCSRCQSTWFCSEECIREAWKSGHKQHCQEPSKQLPVPSAVRDQARGDDLFSLSNNEGEYIVIVRDPSTGVCFDSLTDRDLVFCLE